MDTLQGDLCCAAWNVCDAQRLVVRLTWASMGHVADVDLRDRKRPVEVIVEVVREGCFTEEEGALEVGVGSGVKEGGVGELLARSWPRARP